MTPDTLFWSSGLSLALGGLLASIGWILFAILDPDHQSYNTRLWMPLNLLVIFGGVFMALGLPGFYVLQAEETGILGLVGTVIFFIGIVIPYIGVQSVETMTMPDLPTRFMLLVQIGGPSLIVGGLLLSTAIWQADIFPRWMAAGLFMILLAGIVQQAGFLPKSLQSLIPAGSTLLITGYGIAMMTMF